MKKGYKFGFMVFASLLLILGCVITSNKTEAAINGSKPLKLELIGTDSTCSIDTGGYWSSNASASAQNNLTSTSTPKITCTFSATGEEILSIAGTQLTGPTGSTPIAVSNIKTKNTCTTGSTISGTCGLTTATALTAGGAAIFTKTANKIGTGTFTEALTLNVPAGQIPGTYTGEIRFTLQ